MFGSQMYDLRYIRTAGECHLRLFAIEGFE